MDFYSHTSKINTFRIIILCMCILVLCIELYRVMHGQEIDWIELAAPTLFIFVMGFQIRKYYKDKSQHISDKSDDEKTSV